jgi:6,7-dimethyl-8-ribityllumazine synthase
MHEGWQGRGGGVRVAVVVSRFNAEVTGLLEEGALKALAHHGVAQDDIEVFHVPGAFELPGVVARLLHRGDFSAVVTLGCVIRGETAHFDFVAGEAARGLSDLSRAGCIPVIFGVLTTETLEQALVRAGARSEDPAANKGWEAAEAALEMVHLYRRIR